MRPLEGITVVSIEHAIAAPLATRQLADLGARVIKIERPGVGDFARHYDTAVNGLCSQFVWTNRSKESLALDLKHPRANDILLRLLKTADVFMQNLAPGAAARLGLDHATLKTVNPGLIVCNISGYGEGGPYAARKAYDLLVQCEAGLLSINGTPDDMVKAPIAVADIATGMYAFSSVLAAVIRRMKTGEGAEIDITMLEALGEWMGFPLYFAKYGGTAPPRSGAFHSAIAPYGPYRAGDGGQVFFGIQNEREWQRFCRDVLGNAALATDSRFDSNDLRSKNREALTQTIESALAPMTAPELQARLDAADIANAHLNSMHDLAAHPQLQARDRWHAVATSAGTIDMLTPPFNISNADPCMGAVPDVGEHSAAILGELGFSQGEIEALRSDAAI